MIGVIYFSSVKKGVYSTRTLYPYLDESLETGLTILAPPLPGESGGPLLGPLQGDSICTHYCAQRRYSQTITLRGSNQRLLRSEAVFTDYCVHMRYSQTILPEAAFTDVCVQRWYSHPFALRGSIHKLFHSEAAFIYHRKIAFNKDRNSI